MSCSRDNYRPFWSRPQSLPSSDPFTVPLFLCPNMSFPPSFSRSGCNLFHFSQFSHCQTTFHATMSSPERMEKQPENQKALDFAQIFVAQSFNLGILILEWVLGETNPSAGRPVRLVVKATSRTQLISWPRRFYFQRPTTPCPFPSAWPSLGPHLRTDHCPPSPSQSFKKEAMVFTGEHHAREELSR